MGNNRKTATTTQNERVTRAVEEEFMAAAAARWGEGGEEFLWRSRRCLEAMLYALLFEKGADVTAVMEAGKGLDELLKQPELKGLLPREVRDHIDTVRKYGNTGTHFQVDGDVGATSTHNTALALDEVIRWYFKRGGPAVPATIDRHLLALRDAHKRILSRLETTLTEERERADALTRQLSAQPPSRAAPPDAPRSIFAPWVGGLCAAIVAGAFGYVLGKSTVSPSAMREGASVPSTVTTAGAVKPPPVPPSVAPSLGSLPTSPPPEIPPAETPPAETPLSEAPALDAPRDPGVPDGAPPRCSAMQRSARIGGRVFCIDAEYVTMHDYRRCVAQGSCSRPEFGTGCNWQNGPAFDGNAANCVSREQALTYCSSRAEGAASLPTRAEWRAVRARRDLILRDDTDEWTADDAPGGRAWTRGARTDADFAWQIVLPRGNRSLSFRCVVR